jgi:hypothetical protein
MASTSPAYRTLLNFMSSLSYTDFSTLSYSLFEELLQAAEVDFEQNVYMLDVPPYTTPAIELCFEVSQQTGHRNKIRLTFTEQGELSELHLYTSY